MKDFSSKKLFNTGLYTVATLLVAFTAYFGYGVTSYEHSYRGPAGLVAPDHRFSLNNDQGCVPGPMAFNCFE